MGFEVSFYVNGHVVSVFCSDGEKIGLSAVFTIIKGMFRVSAVLFFVSVGFVLCFHGFSLIYSLQHF